MTGTGTVLILGGGGRLGRALLDLLAGARRRATAPSQSEADLMRPATLSHAIDRAEPVCVVNAAAVTDVPACEGPAMRATVFAVNAEGPGALARVCAAGGIPLVHVSTDYVFNGAKRTPYGEDDVPDPLQVYGASKLEGERAVLDAYPGALVVRVSTLFGPPHPPRPAFVDHILRQARTGGTLEVVEAPVSSPTYAPDAAAAIMALLDRGASGVVHVVNAGSCSRIELARAAVEAAGLEDHCRIVARPEPEGSLRRPAYSVLDDGRLRSLLGRSLPSWRDAVATYVRASGEAPS